MEVAKHKRSVFAAKVHTVSFAEGPGFAILAGFGLLHPCAIAVRFEAVFPDGPEGIAVDITLVILATDGGARRDRAVNEDRRN